MILLAYICSVIQLSENYSESLMAPYMNAFAADSELKGVGI